MNRCPTLKVHDKVRHQTDSVRYLGNMLTPQGGLNATLDDRRRRGWGKVSQILGILSEMNSGHHRLEIGLVLRMAILTNSLLFCLEAWSNLNEQSLKRLEQVDSALLRALVNGHSKCPVIFFHLETGTLKLRHLLVINRLMYHHHILTLFFFLIQKE